MYRYQLLTYPERPARGRRPGGAGARCQRGRWPTRRPTPASRTRPPADPLHPGADAVTATTHRTNGPGLAEPCPPDGRSHGPAACRVRRSTMCAVPCRCAVPSWPGAATRRRASATPTPRADTSGGRCTARTCRRWPCRCSSTARSAGGWRSALTTSVIQQIEEHSPYKVVPADRADTVLEGVITDANTTTLSTDSYTGLPQEQSYNITVSFTWKNLRTGQVYAQRRDFDQHTSYFPTLGEATSVGSTDAAQRLATGHRPGDAGRLVTPRPVPSTRPARPATGPARLGTRIAVWKTGRRNRYHGTCSARRRPAQRSTAVGSGRQIQAYHRYQHMAEQRPDRPARRTNRPGGPATAATTTAAAGPAASAAPTTAACGSAAASSAGSYSSPWPCCSSTCST